jgi:hypothetical protein
MLKEIALLLVGEVAADIGNGMDFERVTKRWRRFVRMTS